MAWSSLYYNTGLDLDRLRWLTRATRLGLNHSDKSHPGLFGLRYEVTFPLSFFLSSFLFRFDSVQHYASEALCKLLEDV